MKKILFILALFTANGVFAIDRFVDPNLSIGNGTTLFTTITAAVNGAVNGDRILIVAGTYNEPTLTLNKSLVIIPQVAGTYVSYNGNITIAGFPGMNLSILGFRLGIYSITANAITSGSASNRAVVNIVDSRMANLTIDQDYYELTAAQCQLTSTVTFRFGNFCASKTNDLFVNDEPSINTVNSKILIAADTIIGSTQYRNDDCPVVISNCILSGLYFWKWNNNVSTTNRISNNEFQSASIFFPIYGVPGYNFDFSSNQFIGVLNFYSGSFTCSACFGSNTCCGIQGSGCTPGYYDGVAGPSSLSCNISIEWSTTFSAFPSPTVNGFFKWTYNGIDLPCATPAGNQPLVLSRIIGTTGTNINSGNPNHDYYDIDLTINDRGRTGGPYSILNYNPTFNPSNGKAYVFDLEIPADLFPGQQVDIKAKGYHRN